MKKFVLVLFAAIDILFNAVVIFLMTRNLITKTRADIGVALPSVFALLAVIVFNAGQMVYSSNKFLAWGKEHPWLQSLTLNLFINCG